MCGRFALFSNAIDLARRFSAEVPACLRSRYNLTPTENILIVRDENNKRHFAWVRWGLVPHWAKEIDLGYATINARAETVAHKPVFRDAFRRRRCLVPADGYFEWQVIPGSKSKQPWFIVLRSRLPMAFAGLWEQWRGPMGENLESCAIIVTDGNVLTRPIHERMPVIIAPDHWNDWLGLPARNVHGVQQLLKAYPDGEMMAWPVNRMVNNPRNDSEECIQELE